MHRLACLKYFKLRDDITRREFSNAVRHTTKIYSGLFLWLPLGSDPQSQRPTLARETIAAGRYTVTVSQRIRFRVTRQQHDVIQPVS
jgi:hypothetical protein